MVRSRTPSPCFVSALLTEDFLASLRLEGHTSALTEYVFLLDVCLASVEDFENLGMSTVEARRLFVAAQQEEKRQQEGEVQNNVKREYGPDTQNKRRKNSQLDRVGMC